MSERVTAVVPVASSEPDAVVADSVAHLGDIGLDVVYVADNPSSEVIATIEGANETVLARTGNHGRRAGALNDALDVVNTEYVALFDIDTRPSETFVENCVSALDAEPTACIASAPRYVTNEGESLPAKLVSVEYTIIGDLYQLISKTEGFIQFNGLSGVIRSNALREFPLDEEVLCEDVDFMTRAFAAGRDAVLVDDRIGEQAPPTFRGLFAQQTRWLEGGLETAIMYWRLVFGSDCLSVDQKASWLVQLATPVILPIATLLVLPLLPFLQVVLWSRLTDRNSQFAFRKAVLCPLFLFLLNACAIVALARTVTDKQSPWVVPQRSQSTDS